MSNSIDDIAPSLERQLTLRSFNRSALQMQLSEGSDLAKAIGIGYKVDTATKGGGLVPVQELYPSFFNNMVNAFSILPITKYFGLTIADAMALPVDEWYRIRNAARKLYEKEPPDTTKQLLEIISGMLKVRQITNEE
jgi:hypothetical protein